MSQDIVLKSSSDMINMVQDIEQESEHNIIKEDIVDTETMQHPFP
jgi:hypothetical protein